VFLEEIHLALKVATLKKVAIMLAKEVRPPRGLQGQLLAVQLRDDVPGYGNPLVALFSGQHWFKPSLRTEIAATEYHSVTSNLLKKDKTS
jgi:hypothetical protein